MCITKDYSYSSTPSLSSRWECPQGFDLEAGLKVCARVRRQGRADIGIYAHANLSIVAAMVYVLYFTGAPEGRIWGYEHAHWVRIGLRLGLGSGLEGGGLLG
eukprot:736338-Amorphochlora_amoeboformis.AAC.1